MLAVASICCTIFVYYLLYLHYVLWDKYVIYCIVMYILYSWSTEDLEDTYE